MSNAVSLIHGIRDHAEYAQRVASVLESDPHIRVRPISYEYFDVVRFLLPFSSFRRKPVERITRLLRAELATRPDTISIIAHSFGTYIIAKILSNYEPGIIFHRLILCGSIIPDDFDWARHVHQLSLYESGGWFGINDCGMKDIWPVLAKSVTWGYGSSGRFGFGHPHVKDRFFDIGHSDFFKAEFVKDYWLPYLSNGTIVEGVLDRAPNSWWVSALTVVKLPYAALGLLLVLVLVMWCSGPRCDTKDFGTSRLNYGNIAPPFRVETANLRRNSDCSVTLSFMPIPELATFAGKWMVGSKAPYPTIKLEWDSGVKDESEHGLKPTVYLSSCPSQKNASNRGYG